MDKNRIILGIETSCDETGAAVLSKVEDRIEILSNVVASSASMQSKYGGIIPEQAAREQIKSIIPVIKEALSEAKVSLEELSAIAVTEGPGLIGSLLVGVETAKTLALTWEKPLVPVNHLLGHFYANWISESVSSIKYKVLSTENQKRQNIHNTKYLIPNTPTFPCLGLLVSGGHSDLVLFKDHQTYEYLGGTRDDAAGECFDKCARLLGLPYPGGPQVSKMAKKGNPKAYKLPRPMLDSKDYDFSFSGLKTAVSNLLNTIEFTAGGAKRQDQLLQDLCASIEAAIVDSLVKKVVTAAKETKVEQIMIAGGVAANQRLISELKMKIENLELKITLHIPPIELCTDNAAMIASRAFFEKPLKDPLSLEANPNLSLSN